MVVVFLYGIHLLVIWKLHPKLLPWAWINQGIDSGSAPPESQWQLSLSGYWFRLSSPWITVAIELIRVLIQAQLPLNYSSNWVYQGIGSGSAPPELEWQLEWQLQWQLLPEAYSWGPWIRYINEVLSNILSVNYKLISLLWMPSTLLNPLIGLIFYQTSYLYLLNPHILTLSLTTSSLILQSTYVLIQIVVS
jgi:hypothetical protein